MRYFPFTNDHFEHQFGIRALGATEPIVEATEEYLAEIELKRRLLLENRDYYFQFSPDSTQAQNDVFDLIVAGAKFLHGGKNGLTGETITRADDSPLLSISHHVQEDLTIVSGDPATGHALIAGCVAFPSGWCIGDKLGQSILAIHRPVPEFDSVLNPPTDRLLQRLKVDRPVWRRNWGVRASALLDQSPIHRAALNRERDRVTAENAGEKCFFRVERQTLARLPTSGDILFAIHTHQCQLALLTSTEKSNLLGVLQSCPESTLQYKGILPMHGSLVEYLRSHTV